MRPSANRHVLSVLRKVIAPMEQWRFAKLAGCSEETVRKVEKGERPLTKDLAAKIALVTGVAEEWLLDNDLGMPAFTKWGEPFTRESYERHKAALREQTPVYLEAMTPDFLFSYYEIMRCILAKLDRGQKTLAFFRIEEFLKAFLEEFTGCSMGESVPDYEQARELIKKDLRSAEKLALAMRSKKGNANTSPEVKAIAAEVRKHLEGMEGYLCLPR